MKELLEENCSIYFGHIPAFAGPFFLGFFQLNEEEPGVYPVILKRVCLRIIWACHGVRGHDNF